MREEKGCPHCGEPLSQLKGGKHYCIYGCDELIKVCPFCGELPEITKHFKEEMWSLLHRCKIIGAMKLDWRESTDSLVNIWNTRSSARVEELEKINKILIDAIKSAIKDMENIPQIMIRSAHNPHADLLNVLEYIKNPKAWERRIEEYKKEILEKK